MGGASYPQHGVQLRLCVYTPTHHKKFKISDSHCLFFLNFSSSNRGFCNLLWRIPEDTLRLLLYLRQFDLNKINNGYFICKIRTLHDIEILEVSRHHPLVQRGSLILCTVSAAFGLRTNEDFSPRSVADQVAVGQGHLVPIRATNLD